MQFDRTCPEETRYHNVLTENFKISARRVEISIEPAQLKCRPTIEPSLVNCYTIIVPLYRTTADISISLVLL